MHQPLENQTWKKLTITLHIFILFFYNSYIHTLLWLLLFINCNVYMYIFRRRQKNVNAKLINLLGLSLKKFRINITSPSYHSCEEERYIIWSKNKSHSKKSFFFTSVYIWDIWHHLVYNIIYICPSVWLYILYYDHHTL